MKKIIIAAGILTAAGFLAGCGGQSAGTATISPAAVTVSNTAAPVTIVPSPVTVQPTVTVQPPPPPVTVTQAPSTVVQSPSTFVQAPSTVTQQSDSGPADSLAGQEVRSDRSIADSTIRYWIPQLSSTQSGSEAWSRFTTTQATYPDAFMVWSNDYSTSQVQNYFQTLVPREFSTAAEANAWCDSEGFSADNCFARRLSHQDGP